MLTLTKLPMHCGKKIYSLWTSTKKAIKKGGRQGRAALDKLKSGTYTLNLGGYKRKLEHELESEKK